MVAYGQWKYVLAETTSQDTTSRQQLHNSRGLEDTDERVNSALFERSGTPSNERRLAFFKNNGGKTHVHEEHSLNVWSKCFRFFSPFDGLSAVDSGGEVIYPKGLETSCAVCRLTIGKSRTPPR